MRHNTDIRDSSGVRRRARLASVLAVLGLVGFSASCGDDSGSSQGVATVDPEAAADDGEGSDDDGGGDGAEDENFEDAMAEYTSCMRDEGVDMSQPVFVGEDGGSMVVAGADTGDGPSEVEMDSEDIDELLNDEDYQAAQEKCEPLMEGAFQEFELDPEEQAEMQDQMLDWAQCMRDRGHDVDDPTFTDEGGVVMESDEASAGGGGGPDLEDEEFREDSEACNEEVGMDGPVHRRSEASPDDGVEGGAGQ